MTHSLRLTSITKSKKTLESNICNRSYGHALRGGQRLPMAEAKQAWFEGQNAVFVQNSNFLFSCFRVHLSLNFSDSFRW